LKDKICRLLGRTLLPVALSVVVSLSMMPGSVRADEPPNTSGEPTPDILAATGGWVYEEVDVPTGKNYMLVEVFGGWWADAEKNPDPGDDLLCWAATACNMLEWTGWGFVDYTHNGTHLKFGNTDDFFQFYKDHVDDTLGGLGSGLRWWFDGELTSGVELVDHDGFYPGHNLSDYYSSGGDVSEVVPRIFAAIGAGNAVGVAIVPIAAEGGHLITCWGFNYDDDYGTDEEEHYLGIWVTDSDSHKHRWDPPNVLRYYSVTYNHTENRWEMLNYGGGWHISGAGSLAVVPGATRPSADSGGPYVGYEGSSVAFDASGSTDGGTLWYRWDFDGDGVWDTGWLGSATAEWTWDDDYDTDNVYLEVFNEELRDMSISTVTIRNVAPIVTAVGDVINENDYATVSGNITDPGINDTFTVAINWGDGSSNTYNYPAGTTEYSESHRYLDDGDSGVPTWDYNVTVTVTDKDGGVGVADTTVTVNNVDPVVEEPYISGQPNEEFILPVVHEVNFEAAFTDAGTLDTHTAVWNWGDGTTSVGGIIPGSGSGTATGSHTYMLPGDYTVTVTVTDDDTGTHSNSMLVYVADVDEALEIFNQYIQDLDASVFRGQAAQRKSAFSNMFSALQDKWLEQEYKGMIQDLRNSIRSRADGLIDGRANDDWIINLEAQEHICQKVDDIAAYLEYLIGI
jgi:hypothetical protein